MKLRHAFKSYPQEISAVTRRILLELARRQRSLIFWGIFPLVILVLNSLILEERLNISRADAFSSAAPPSLVGVALFFSCLGGSVATVVAEREQQTLKRLFLSPLNGLSYFFGVLGAHLVIGLVQSGVLYGLTFWMGGEFLGSWLLGLLVIFLSIIAYVGVGFILGTQFARRTEDVNALVASFGVPLMLLGGAFMPTSFFPDSLTAIANYNPVYHMIEAFQSVAADEVLTAEGFFAHLIFLGLFALGAGGLSWLAYRRMARLERQL